MKIFSRAPDNADEPVTKSPKNKSKSSIESLVNSVKTYSLSNTKVYWKSLLGTSYNGYICEWFNRSCNCGPFRLSEYNRLSTPSIILLNFNLAIARAVFPGAPLCIWKYPTSMTKVMTRTQVVMVSDVGGIRFDSMDRDSLERDRKIRAQCFDLVVVAKVYVLLSWDSWCCCSYRGEFDQHSREPHFWMCLNVI